LNQRPPIHSGIVTRFEVPIRPRLALRVTALALAIGLAMVAIPAYSAAAPLPGPSMLSTGFSDLPILQSPSAAVRGRWLRAARAIGASVVRLSVDWAGIAPRKTRGFDPTDPADPHYYWPVLDGAVRTATADGLEVVLTLNNAPSWAEGPGRPRNAPFGSWRPQVSALAKFAGAVAERYDGHFPDPLHKGAKLPRVGIFQAWNEPNLPYYLSPQWVRGRHGGWVPESPILYRAMLNAVYAAIKPVTPDATVLSAGTAPYGRPPGVSSMTPVLFMRELLCLHNAALQPEPCPDPAHFDGYDAHPYSVTPTLPARAAEDVSVPDLGKLQRIVGAALRSGRLLPAGPKPLWITEIGWESKPPNPNGISPALQARYLALGFYTVWRQNVSHVLWFTVRDSGTSSQFFGGGNGLYYADGRAKPATIAFRFPFVAVRGALQDQLTLWGRAPAPGTVIVEQRVHGRWRVLTQLTTTAGGIFYAKRVLPGRPLLRAVQGTSASLAWAT
jgi:hypothetical protein